MFNIQEASAPITNVITQLWFNSTRTVQFAHIEPAKFWDTTQPHIVAVWHIKPHSNKLLKLNRVILSIHNSPNKSVQRAALWARLCKMRSELKGN